MKLFHRRTIDIFLALALGAVGWAVNRSPLVVAGGHPLQLGQIPALIAALVAGPAAGLVASGIANLTALMDPDSGLFAWVLVAEAATVGALMTRGRSPFAADLLFWTCVGVPVLGALHVASGVSMWTATARIGFQLASAGYNLAFSGLIAIAVRDVLGRTPGRVGMRRQLNLQLLGLMAFITLSRVILIAGFSARSQRENAIEEHEKTATAVAGGLDGVLGKPGPAPAEPAAILDGMSKPRSAPATDGALWDRRLFNALAGFGGHVLVVEDVGGRVIYSSDSALHPVHTLVAGTHRTPADRYHWRHPAANGKSGGGVYVGGSARTAYGWTVLLEEPESSALRATDDMSTLAVLMSLVNLIGLLFLLRWWTDVVTRPLRRMTAYIRGRESVAVAGAQGSVAVPDEAGQPEEVVEMLRALVRSDDRVREAVQTLDKQVAERTADLVEARDRAESANAAKSLFLGNMSHELRSPLNVILGQTEMLDEEILGTLQPEQRAALGQITTQGNHLLDIIGDLLDVSRIENGRMEVAVEDVDLAMTLGALRGMFDGDAVVRRVHLLVEVPGHPVLVRADPMRLRQVLINLLSNALKFTPATGSVDVRVEWAADGATPAGILVRDTGIGIPEEAQSRVFGAFEQASSGLSRNHDGAGLGLAISRQLCALMGMTLTLESTVGEGSCFRVGLAPQAPA